MKSYLALALGLTLNLADLDGSPGMLEAVEPVPMIEATVTGPVSPDGTEVALDLPKALHMKNVGGSDGAGLCVFTSINHAGYWHNIEALFGFQQWMRKYPGGGYPSKVKAKIEEFCRVQSLPVPPYVQVESRDLEILKLACKTGRMPSVTYSFSPSGRYGGARIAHMVTLLHADDQRFCVLDNNFPGTWEWMSPAEFLRSYTGGSGNGWSVIFLVPGPPPPPKSRG